MRTAWVLVGMMMVGMACSAQKLNCHVRTAAATDGEAALSREEYEAALALFEKGGNAPESRAGVIHVLLAQDKVAEAGKLATAWAAEQPQSAVALETLGEVQFRDGRLEDAYRTAKQAQGVDACLARVYLLRGEYEDVTANFATSQKHFELAHKLDPEDPDLLSAWIGTLPRKQRLDERGKLAKNERLVNAKDRGRIAEGLAHAGNYSKNDCTVVTPFDHAQIPIVPIRSGPYGTVGLALDVNFNGKRRRMEIDTGASGLVLSRGAAAGLGLTREQTVISYGIGDGGQVATSVAHVQSVKIGNLEFRNCEVEILEKRSALDIDGLIGGDVFSKYLLTLDFPHIQVRLDPLPARPGMKAVAETLKAGDAPRATDGVESGDSEEEKPHDRYIAPEMQDWTRVYRGHHDFLLPVRIGEERERLFVVDTGASSMLISPEVARGVTKVHADDSTGLRGISGDVLKVYSTGKLLIQFAHLQQHIPEMSSIDTTKFSHDEGMEVAGFMGAPILNMLTVHFDYRDNLIKFEYSGPK